MLTKLHVRNFKSLRHVTIDLEPFTVFVGPNGSGKTSILQAIDLICQPVIPHGKADAVLNRLSASKSRGVSEPVEMILTSKSMRWRMRERLPQLPLERRPRGGVFWDGAGTGVSLTPTADSWHPRKSGEHIPPNTTVLQLELSSLRNPDIGEREFLRILPSGRGLHTCLASMALNDPDSWHSLQNDLVAIIPSIQRLRHAPISPQKPISLLLDTHKASNLTVHEVSEGALLVLGMLAVFYSTPRPCVLLIDDMGRGLHPRAQREWVQLLRRTLERHSDLQIIATTHSPYLLDSMRHEEVRLTLLHDGQTLCAPLQHHPDFEKWKMEMAPGEMWSLFGEQWLASRQEEKLRS